MIQDYFQLAGKNLRKRKLRSWLTILGIVIAVAIIFVLISLSVGLREAIDAQFQILGADKFFILPLGQLGAPGTGGAVQLTIADVNVVDKVSGVKDLTYATVGNAKIDFNRQTRYFFVAGLPLDRIKLYTESTSLSMEDGRMLEKGDSGKVVIGWDYKNSGVYDKPVKVNDMITINGEAFRVKGILARVGNPSDDRNILMPLDDFKSLFNSGDRIDEIVAQVQPGTNITVVADNVERKLVRSRGLTEKTKDFSISTPEELLSSFGIILNVITAFLVGVASISLLVGSIGIANTMYTSVLERTREIGTMKAVGARNSDIAFIFLIESGLLGLIGGIIGLVVGIGIAKGVELIAVSYLNTTLLKAAIPIWLVIGCLSFGFLVGATAGTFPAYRASKLKPVDALRYE